LELKCGGLLFDRHKTPLTRRFVVYYCSAVYTILAANTEVRASPAGNNYDAWGSAQFLGYAVLESSSAQIGKGGKTTWEVGLPLTRSHLQKIEEVRNGRDVWLMVHCSFTAAVISNTGTTNYGPFMSNWLSDTSGSTGCCVYKIARSDWLKHRSELGYGDSLLIEIPLHVPTKKGMAKALEHLGAASMQFGEDRADDTLASCYTAVEYLAQTSGAKNPDQNGFEKLLVSLEDQEKRNKIKALMHYLCQYFQVGRHESGKENVVVDRRDAEYALILSQATLAYLAKHWQTEPNQSGYLRAPLRRRPLARKLPIT
jgi:hypothetical protein